MDENYKLLISNDGIRLVAAAEWGILHGLETLGLAYIRSEVAYSFSTSD